MDGKVLLGAFTEEWNATHGIQRVEVADGPAREEYQYSEEERKVIEERLEALGYFD
jgi:hypothetical protein